MRRRGEQGSESLTGALILPLFLLVVFTVISASLHLHGRNVAQSAASACAEVSRVLGSSSGTGQEAAAQVLSSSKVLTASTITVQRGATTTTCTVTGTVNSPVRLPMSHISRTVSMPTERITRP